jgi:hypothetical protein
VNAALIAKANASEVSADIDNLQGQIDQIVISAAEESVVAPEVAASRVSDTGVQYQTLKERLDTEFREVKSGAFKTIEGTPEYNIIDDYYVYAKSSWPASFGTTVYDTTSSYTDYIDVSEYESITYSAYLKISTSTYFGDVLYDENKTAVIGYLNTGATEDGFIERTIVIPPNVKYIRCSIPKALKNNFYFNYTLKRSAVSLVENETQRAQAAEQQLEKNIDVKISQSKDATRPLLVEMQSFFWGGMTMPAEISGNNCEFTFDCTSGDTIVTVIAADPVELNTITTSNWFCGWITYDGITYSICNLRKHSDTELKIYPPCSRTATGVKVGNAIFDGGTNNVGMHLSANGYKAYAQHIFNSNPRYCYVGNYIDRFMPEIDATNPFIKYGGQSYGDTTTLNRSNGWLQRYTRKAYRLGFYSSYTPHTTRTGVKWTVNVGGKKGYLETFINAIAGNIYDLPSDQYIHVTLTLDGVLKEDRVLTNTICQRICFEFSDAEVAELNIYSDKWAAVSGETYGFDVSNTTWWVTAEDSKDTLIPAGTVVAQEFDSWGVYHNEACATEMSRLIKENTGAYVPYENHSSGSKTSAWGKGWFYENVWKYHPGIALFDFVINDYNSMIAPTIPETIEGSDGTVYDNKLTSEEYCENMRTLIEMSKNNGIQPIICMATQHGNAMYYEFSQALIDSLSNRIE